MTPQELIDELKKQIEAGNGSCDITVYNPATMSHEEIVMVSFKEEIGIVITTY